MGMAAPEPSSAGKSLAQLNTENKGIPWVGGKTGTVPTTVTGQARTFRDTEFVLKESTGAVVGKRGEKKPGIENREITFSAELTTQYEHFLHDHLTALLKVTNPSVLNNDAHIHELRLREALCTNNLPDKDKITAYLESSDGWAITTQLLEHQTALKLFANGLHAATRPRGERVDEIDENTIRLHMNQGTLNRLIMDRIVPYLNQRINVTAGRPEERGLAGNQYSDFRRWQSLFSSIGMGALEVDMALTAGYALPTALTLGVVAGAVLPGAMAVRNTLNSGVTIDLRQCGAALQVIQNDANEMAYLKQVLNIDASNYELVGPNQIRLRDAHALAPNNIRQIQTEILQGLYAREQFYTSIGVPYEQLDALPEQHLYQYFRGSAEQTGVHWQRRHEEIFQPQTDGIRDTAGNTPDNAAFLTGGATLDFEGNLRRYMQARRQVMVEMMQDHATRVLDRTLSTNARTTIQEKISAREATGTEMTARKKPMEDRKEALNKEKTGLTSEKTILDEYTAAKTTLETEQKKFETEFEDAFLAGRTIVDEYTQVNDLLTNQADAASIPARRNVIKGNLNAALVAASAQAAADLAAAYAGLGVAPPPEAISSTQNDYKQRTRELFQSELEALAQETTELTNQRTRLTQIRDGVRTATRTLNEKNDRTVTSAKENLITTRADYTAITGWGIGAVSLQTMSVDEIMVQVNAANVANNLNGWPEAQNNDSANRIRVINAIAEAKADYEESFDTQKPVRDIEYTALTGWGVTADQLRTMSRQQLFVLINNANAANILNGWPAAENVNPANIVRVNRAVEEARNRMILRHNAVLSARLTDIDAQIKTQDNLIEAINFENEKDILKTIDDLMGRQDKIFEIAFDVVTDRARFTDINSVDVNDATFTAAEKAAVDGEIPPVGYWRIMNALFAYETKADRNTYVGKMLKTLPPKKLASYLNSSLGILAPGDPGFDDISTALTNLENGIATDFTGIEVRGLFRDIINGLRAEVNAI